MFQCATAVNKLHFVGSIAITPSTFELDYNYKKERNELQITNYDYNRKLNIALQKVGYSYFRSFSSDTF